MMDKPVRLRLVFKQCDEMTVQNFMLARDIETGAVMFDRGQINPDKSAVIRSNELSGNLVSTALELMRNGKFPFTEGYRWLGSSIDKDLFLKGELCFVVEFDRP